MEKFILVLGDNNPILPGKMWTTYEVDVHDDRMICTAKKDPNVVVEILFSSFKEAEFGIGSGNLWLQCKLEKGNLTFCSPRKSWKSEAGKKLISGIEEVCSVNDMKAYKQYTGKLAFLYMFK